MQERDASRLPSLCFAFTAPFFFGLYVPFAAISCGTYCGGVLYYVPWVAVVICVLFSAVAASEPQTGTTILEILHMQWTLTLLLENPFGAKLTSQKVTKCVKFLKFAMKIKQI